MTEEREKSMKVGIIGAGTMGAGIAQVFAGTKGYDVLLCDLNRELAQKGKDRIAANLETRVKRGKLTEQEAEENLASVTPGVAEDCKDCELIVEAAAEDIKIKQDTFRRLGEICPKNCVFATNTSSLSITEIGNGLDRPVAGMHFFNPAPVMKLVEIIAGLGTPLENLEFLKNTAEDIGKVPVQVQESAGFVVNRMLIPMINEAAGIYAEGIASAEDIDTAMKLGANHPMGPLALGDLIGLDVVLAIMEVLQRETGDSKYRPHPYLKKMVRGRRLGKKSGQGFYVYE